MQAPTFPKELQAQIKEIERLLSRNAVDIDRLWRRVGSSEGGQWLQGIPTTTESTTTTTTTTTTTSSSSSSTSSSSSSSDSSSDSSSSSSDSSSSSSSSSSSDTSSSSGGCTPDGCQYLPTPDAGAPFGIGWLHPGDINCESGCVCPPVDAAFYALHGYPSSLSDPPLLLDCVPE